MSRWSQAGCRGLDGRWALLLRGVALCSRACIAVSVVVLIAMASLTALGGESRSLMSGTSRGPGGGWVSGVQNVSTMTIREDRSYQASVPGRSADGRKYYLEDGKLRYRSSRSTGIETWAEFPPLWG